MNFVNEYNALCRSKDIESFIPCKHSMLYKDYTVIKNTCDEISTTKHNILKMCTNTHTSYFTCMTYKSEIVVKQRHICDIFPVVLGSELDILLCKWLWCHRGNNESEFVYDYETGADLCGMLYIDSSLSYFPYLLTNRKEMVHLVRRGNGIFCLYTYDVENRGHKFSIDSNKEFIYRNEKGEEHKTVNQEIFLRIDNKHLDLQKMNISLERLYNHDIEIDSLSNKLILSPINILETVISLAQKNPDQIKEMIVRGELERFASSKIIYTGTRSKFNIWSSITTFNYRKIQPNQILRRNAEGADRVVIRPIPKNVNKSCIPSDTEYFFCLLDKSASITSPNRWLLLLPHVQITQTPEMDYFTIDQLMVYLVSINFIIEKKDLDENDLMLVVCGGLSTKYIITVDFFLFFKTVKSKNNHFEVYMFKNVVMVNLTKGLAFIPFQDFCVSPLELNTLFLNEKKNIPLSLFGYNCSDDNKKYFGYGVPNKMIVATGHYKTRIGSVDAIKYFENTSENCCVYFKDSEYWKTENAMMDLKISFSGHPQITADSYILDKNIPFNSIILLRSHVSIDVQSNMNFLVNDTIQLFSEYDSCGVVIRKYACLMKIQKRGAPLKHKIFPQMKMFLKRVKTNGGFDYTLYKYYDERHFLENETKIYMSAVVKNKKIFIDIITSTNVDEYDGMKMSDQCSQKGLVVKQDIKNFNIDTNVVGSLYSLVGRSPIIEMKCVAGQSKDEILNGNYPLYVLKNLTSNMKSFSPIKIDMYSAKIMLTNGISKGLYSLQQDAIPIAERGKFLPKESKNSLSIIGNCKVGVEFYDRYGTHERMIPFTKRRAVMPIVDEMEAKCKK